MPLAGQHKRQKKAGRRCGQALSVSRVICGTKVYQSPRQLFALRFLREKHNLFRNPYLEGVNLVFPFLERRNAIFIDFSILGTDVKERRAAAVAFLRERGHRVEEVKSGTETFLKVENAYYRIFPGARLVYKLPVQGVNLVPVYW